MKVTFLTYYKNPTETTGLYVYPTARFNGPFGKEAIVDCMCWLNSDRHVGEFPVVKTEMYVFGCSKFTTMGRHLDNKKLSRVYYPLNNESCIENHPWYKRVIAAKERLGTKP